MKFRAFAHTSTLMHFVLPFFNKDDDPKHRLEYSDDWYHVLHFRTVQDTCELLVQRPNHLQFSLLLHRA